MQYRKAREEIMEKLNFMIAKKPDDVRLRALKQAAWSNSWIDFMLVMSSVWEYAELSYNALEEEDLKNAWEDIVECFNEGVMNGGHV